MPNHRLLEVLDKLEKVELVITMDGVEILKHPKIISWSEFIEKGNSVDDETVQELCRQIQSEDTSSLIYTSGTTGNPKGVELSHGNWTFELDTVEPILKFNQGEKYVSWLPGAHVFGQLLDNHYWIRRAMHMHIVDSPLNTVDYAKEVQPHLLFLFHEYMKKYIPTLWLLLNLKQY